MSGTRFGVLLGLAAAAVAAGAFLIGLQVLDDDGPDRPPTGSQAPDGQAAEPSTDEDAADESTATSADAPGEVTAGDLPSPSWVLVISSEGGEDRARTVAEEVAAAGHPAGFLHSDDYESLNPGFWVAYAGPYPDPAAATAAEAEVEADGWTAAYVRCVGSTADCGEPEGGGGDGGDDPDGDDDDD